MYGHPSLVREHAEAFAAVAVRLSLYSVRNLVGECQLFAETPVRDRAFYAYDDHPPYRLFRGPDLALREAHNLQGAPEGPQPIQVKRAVEFQNGTNVGVGTDVSDGAFPAVGAGEGRRD